MPTVRIKLIHAVRKKGKIEYPGHHESIGPTKTVDFDTTQEIIDAGLDMAEEYSKEHPNESFMPYYYVSYGRRPYGLRLAIQPSNPELQKWIKE